MDPADFLIDTASESSLNNLKRDLQSKSQGLLAFVGAGVSRQAGLPLWKELMVKMDTEVQRFRERPEQVRGAVLSHSDVLWQAELFRLELERRAAYERFIRRQFTKRLTTGKEVIHRLVELNFRHFLTTNYDTFLEQALSDCEITFDEIDWTNRQECRDFFLNFLTPDGSRFVVHIHGRADQPRSVVLTHRDYVERYVQSSEYVEKLSVLFATMRIVFIGFSLDDPDLRFILRQVNSRFGTGDVQHYAILGFGEEAQAQVQIERERLERQFGISPIFYNDENGHAALRHVLAALEKQKQSEAAAASVGSTKATNIFDKGAPSGAYRANTSTLLSTAPAVYWNEDPHKGKFGGSPEDPAHTRRLSVDYKGEKSPGLHAIDLVVETLSPPDLQGVVSFHVHPTFPRPVFTKHAAGGKATLSLVAYGAFTVGVQCDENRTRLELDLAEVPALPAGFRSQ